MASSFRARLSAYYRLAKPGIVYGNLLTAVAAFLFAAQWRFPWPLFVATAAGAALVIASACVFNNYLDRGIDARMARTKDRPLVTGAIGTPAALAYGTVLLAAGLLLLFAYANALAAGAALFGWVMYVFVYGWAKRAGPWGTLVGSIPGAAPVLIGYAAGAGRLDEVAGALFLVLALWQMPHFYAIAIRRARDYAEAGIPTLPARRGVARAKRSIVTYIILYAAACALPWLMGAAGYAYLAIACGSGIAWLGRALRGFIGSTRAGTSTEAAEEAAIAWAKGVFGFSLLALLAWCAALAIAPLAP
jgi:protoheme IX farnesyltransferase